MATTPLGFPYPALTDAPNGPAQMQALATAIDNFLTPSAFRGIGVASQSVSANTNIAFAVADDPQTGWNASTHLWVIPVAGRYQISAQTRCGLTAAQPTCAILVNGTLVYINSAATSAAGANAGLSVERSFAVGETIAVQSTAAYAMSTTGQNDNWLSMQRVSA